MRVRISPGVSPFQVDESSASHSTLLSGKHKKETPKVVSCMVGVGFEVESKIPEHFCEFEG